MLRASVKGQLSTWVVCAQLGHSAGARWQCKHLPSRWRPSDPFRPFNPGGGRLPAEPRCSALAFFPECHIEPQKQRGVQMPEGISLFYI